MTSSNSPTSRLEKDDSVKLDTEEHNQENTQSDGLNAGDISERFETDYSFNPASSDSTTSETGSSAGYGPKRSLESDQSITEQACELLERCGTVDAREIVVSCRAGVVVLRGQVSDRRSKIEAERCLEPIPDLYDIMNLLRLPAISE